MSKCVSGEFGHFTIRALTAVVVADTQLCTLRDVMCRPRVFYCSTSIFHVINVTTSIHGRISMFDAVQAININSSILYLVLIPPCKSTLIAVPGTVSTYLYLVYPFSAYVYMYTYVRLLIFTRYI